MKKNYISVAFALFALCSFGQTSSSVLNANNVNTTITDNGFFFTQDQMGMAGYEVPAGSGNHAIYTGSFWFGGTDINGQIKLAAQQYSADAADYSVGPITRYSGAYADASLAAAHFGQTIWTVSKSEIDAHIANYQSASYTMPNGIANWPAHGDTSIGSAEGMLPYIAPFVDVNGDGQYEPDQGDYPCIKGDQATYSIINDAGGLHLASQGDPLIMELHCMFYQYSSIPELENTTFVDIEVVNMGTQTIYDAKASFFLDPDLGNFSDDYIGTDSLREMVYVYNGTNFDAPNSGMPGYGDAPPAVGLKVLSHELSSSMMWTNNAPFPTNDPSYTSHFIAAMNGNYLNGDDQLDGNGNPTDFAYVGDPNISQSWSEYQQANAPGDRRCLASLDAGTLPPDLSFGGADRRTYSYAIIYAKGANHLNSVTELQNTADFVQTHYDNTINTCFAYQTASVTQLKEVEFNLAPNPNTGVFTVQLPEDDSATLEIIDAQGRIVFVQKIYAGDTKIAVDLENGMYSLTVKTTKGSSMKRFVIQ